MTYAEAIQFLYSLQVFGAKPGLDNIRKLATRAGDPHQSLRFIHVAGTNGKGSVCAMLESIYRHSGLRVGLYTSPHLVSFGERIQINRQPIPQSEVARLVTELQPWLAGFTDADHPTFFEVVTVMALRWFAEQKVDLVVWETGLGGRLDATNIVTPLVSVITTVGHDHEECLGHTQAEIAFEKAGIIKRGVPVVTSVSQPEALAVITETASRKEAPLGLVPPAAVNSPALASLQLGLAGPHQRMNAALAIATTQVLGASWALTREQIVEGLRTVHWPGRLQLATLHDGRRVLLDGAHNPDCIKVLAQALQADHLQQQPVLILGMLADKDCQAMCELLAPLFGEIHLVPVPSSRTALPEDVQPVCQAAAPGASITIHASLTDALVATMTVPFTVITGSLYLVGEAMERLGISPTPVLEERSLNEYTLAQP